MPIIFISIGVILTILGLVMGIKSMDIRVYNFIVAGLIIIFTVFVAFGRYKQDVNAANRLIKIDTTTSSTLFNVLDANISNLKSSIKRYRELENKFTREFIGMQKMNFITYNRDSVNILRERFIKIFDEIFQNTLVSEEDELHAEWQNNRNQILSFLTFYNLPNGLSSSEDGKDFKITDSIKKEKLVKLKLDLLESETRINFKIQSIAEKYGINE